MWTGRTPPGASAEGSSAMLSMASMHGASRNYYVHVLPGSDYYLNNTEGPPAQWTGQGAELLGLRGQVDQQAFENLFDGYLPDGSARAVQFGPPSKRNPTGHHPGTDMTFSTKEAAVGWAVCPEHLRPTYELCHRRAVDAAIRAAEDLAAYAQRGKDGQELEKLPGLVVVRVDHFTSRSGDPLLHTHALVLNVAPRYDGTLGTVQGRPIFENKMLLGAIYRAELAAQLEKELGLKIVRRGSNFEIAGLPRDLVRAFSKRREQIKSRMEALGTNDPRVAERITLKTRQRKERASRAELNERWRATAAEHGFSAEQAQALCGKALKHDQATELGEALSGATKTLTFRRGLFTGPELLRAVAEQAPGRGLNVDAIRAGVTDRLTNSSEVFRVGAKNGQDLFCSRAHASDMEDLRRSLEILKGRDALAPSSVSLLYGQAMTRPRSDRPLTDAQEAALQGLTAPKSTVKLLDGSAGTGKKAILEAARGAWEHRGLRVLGVAATPEAAASLQRETHIESCSVRDLLRQLRTKSMGEAFGAAMKKDWGLRVLLDPTPVLRYAEQARKPWIELNRRTVVVVDGAQAVSAQELAELAKIVRKSHATLILSGDELAANGQRGTYDALLDNVKPLRLQRNERQKSALEKKAVQEASAGNTRAALAQLASGGRLHVASDHRAAQDKLISAWRSQGSSRPSENLIICSRDNVAGLNRAAQQARLEDGAIRKRNVEVPGGCVHERDRVRFTRNAPSSGAKRGEEGTVTSIHLGQRTLTVRLDDGRSVWVDRHRFEHLRLAYALTPEESAGRTVSRSFVLASGLSHDRGQLYSAISRAAQATHIYLTRSEAGEALTQLADERGMSAEKSLALRIAEETRQQVQQYGTPGGQP